MNSKNKPNGHAALATKRRGANGSAISLNGMGGAASDDVSELSVANATTSTVGAGAEREAYADVAPAKGGGKRLPVRAASRSPQKRGKKKAEEAGPAKASREIVPGREPLPVDGEAFVDAVHAQVDLVQLEVDLLSSTDDKLVQREVAYLRELRYGKRATPIEDDVPQIIFDLPGPERDKP